VQEHVVVCIKLVLKFDRLTDLADSRSFVK